MNFKLNIINYSNNILINELKDCLNLLPNKYKNLDTKIIIFDNFSRYLLYNLKTLNFIYFFSGIIEYIFHYYSPSTELGCYNIHLKSIHIFEYRVLQMLENKFSRLPSLDNYNEFKSYITKDLLNSYKTDWSKYVLLDSLIHELTHALQHKEKRIPNRFKYLTSKWNAIDIEFEAVSKSIDIFNTNHESFLNILGINGIKISHSLTPLNINYKLNINISEYIKK